MLRFKITIEGESPLIHHCGLRGLDEFSEIKQRINQLAKYKGTNKTPDVVAELRQLETQNSIWTDGGLEGPPILPTHAIRTCIEKGARTLRQGPQVRGGMTVIDSEFHWDKSLGETDSELATRKEIQFSTPVVVNRSRIMRTRARFVEWGCTFSVIGDPELIDNQKLVNWLTIAGARIGLGDWRPACSGEYGRFRVTSIEEVEG